jgi:hypothetical protein
VKPIFLQSVSLRVESQLDQAQFGTEVYRFGRSEGKNRGQRSAPARVGSVFGHTSQELQWEN